MEDNVPDEVENNRREAISDAGGVDAKKLHLGDNNAVREWITTNLVVLN